MIKKVLLVVLASAVLIGGNLFFWKGFLFLTSGSSDYAPSAVTTLDKDLINLGFCIVGLICAFISFRIFIKALLD